MDAAFEAFSEGGGRDDPTGEGAAESSLHTARKTAKTFIFLHPDRLYARLESKHRILYVVGPEEFTEIAAECFPPKSILIDLTAFNCCMQRVPEYLHRYIFFLQHAIRHQ
jgi:hypothetical protein